MHFVKLPLLLLLVCSLGLSQAGLTHRRLRETVPAAIPANTVIISEPASDLRKDQIPVTIIQEAAPETPAIVPQKDEPEQKLRTEAEKANEIASEPVVVATEIKDEKPITELRAADVEPVVPDENDDAPDVFTEILFVDGDSPSDDLSVRQGTPATPASTTQGNFVQQLIQNSPIGQFFNQLTGQQQQQQQQQQQDAQVSADEPAATPAPTIPGFLNPQAAITSAQQAVQNAAQFVGNTTTQAFQGLQQFATNLGTQFQNTLSNFGGNQQGTSDSTTPRPPGPIQSVINNFIGGNNNNQSAAPVAGQGTNPLQGIISFFQGGNRPAQAAAASTPAISESPAATEPEKPSRLDDKIEESQEISEQQQAELDATNEVRNSQEVVGGGNEDSFEEIKPEEVIVVNDDASEQRV